MHVKKRNINYFLIILCACVCVSRNKPGQFKMLSQLYENFEPIGNEPGKYDNVYKCKNRLNNQVFTVKIISISKEEKKNGVPYRIIREVSILKELDHDNVVRLG